MNYFQPAAGWRTTEKEGARELARAVVGGAAESAIIVTVTKERKLEIEGRRADDRVIATGSGDR